MKRGAGPHAVWKVVLLFHLGLGGQDESLRWRKESHGNKQLTGLTENTLESKFKLQIFADYFKNAWLPYRNFYMISFR